MKNIAEDHLTCITYGVALVSRIDKIIDLFCKRALQKRRYSAKETYNLIDPTERSHPIQFSSQKSPIIFGPYTNAHGGDTLQMLTWREWFMILSADGPHTRRLLRKRKHEKSRRCILSRCILGRFCINAHRGDALQMLTQHEWFTIVSTYNRKSFMLCGHNFGNCVWKSVHNIGTCVWKTHAR